MTIQEQITQARQQIAQRQSEATQAEQSLKQVKESLPDIRSQEALRQKFTGLQGRTQRGVVQTAETEVERKQGLVSEYKKELGAYEQQVNEAERQVQTYENDVEAYNIAKKQYSRGIPPSLETGRVRYWMEQLYSESQAAQEFNNLVSSGTLPSGVQKSIETLQAKGLSQEQAFSSLGLRLEKTPATEIPQVQNVVDVVNRQDATTIRNTMMTGFVSALGDGNKSLNIRNVSIGNDNINVSSGGNNGTSGSIWSRISNLVGSSSDYKMGYKNTLQIGDTTLNIGQVSAESPTQPRAETVRADLKPTFAGVKPFGGISIPISKAVSESLNYLGNKLVPLMTKKSEFDRRVIIETSKVGAIVYKGATKVGGRISREVSSVANIYAPQIVSGINKNRDVVVKTEALVGFVGKKVGEGYKVVEEQTIKTISKKIEGKSQQDQIIIAKTRAVGEFGVGVVEEVSKETGNILLTKTPIQDKDIIIKSKAIVGLTSPFLKELGKQSLIEGSKLNTNKNLVLVSSAFVGAGEKYIFKPFLNATMQTKIIDKQFFIDKTKKDKIILDVVGQLTRPITDIDTKQQEAIKQGKETYFVNDYYELPVSKSVSRVYRYFEGFGGVISKSYSDIYSNLDFRKERTYTRQLPFWQSEVGEQVYQVTKESKVIEAQAFGERVKFGFELGQYATPIFPTKFALGLTETTINKKGFAFVKENPLDTTFIASGIALKLSKILLKPVYETVKILPKRILKQPTQFISPLISSIKKEGITTETYMIKSIAQGIKEGRKVVVTNRLRQLFNLEPIYSGNPADKLGYKKAINLLTSNGLTKTEAKESIRLYRPEVFSQQFTGKGIVKYKTSGTTLELEGVLSRKSITSNLEGIKTLNKKIQIRAVRNIGFPSSSVGELETANFLQNLRNPELTEEGISSIMRVGVKQETEGKLLDVFQQVALSKELGKREVSKSVGKVLSFKKGEGKINIDFDQVSRNNIQKLTTKQTKELIGATIPKPKQNEIVMKTPKQTLQQPSVKTSPLIEIKEVQADKLSLDLKQSSTQEEKLKTKDIGKEISVTKEVSKSIDTLRTKSPQIEITKEQAKQKEELKINQANINLLKSSQAQTQQLKQATKQVQKQIQVRRPPKSPTTINPIPIKLGKAISKAKEIINTQPDVFEAFVTKSGKDVSIGKRRTQQEAEQLLKTNIKSTLRAGGFLTRGGSPLKATELKSFGGGEFTLSKRSSSKIIQKRERRLSARPEVSEIQYFKKSKGRKFV